MKIIISILVGIIIAILIIVTFILIREPDVPINVNIEIEWFSYKEKYNKSYNESAENQRRKNLYLKSKKLITEHNERYDKGLESYDLAINQFADLTDKEYIGALHKDDINISDDDDNDNDGIIDGDNNDNFQLIDHYENLTVLQKIYLKQNTLIYNYTDDDENLPENINWIEYGYTNPVLDQGKCGSCYIFSSLAAIEAHYYIKYKTLLQLSHQEVLDCSMILGNTGCKGGYIEYVYNYGMLFGIGLSHHNPYLGEISNKCNKTKPRIYIKKQYYGQNITEHVLKEVLAKYGPVTSPINAGLYTFKFYHSGIYYDSNCIDDNLEHGVTTIGYGKTENNNKEYWLIRNSFGSDWGVNGHMYLARNRDNHCGIATEFSFPQF